MTATEVTSDLPEGTTTENVKVWRFSQYLSSIVSGVDRYAVVILNQPLHTRHFNVLWRRATIRFCADGGANRLYEAISSDISDDSTSNVEHPDYICGDMDSAKSSVLEWFSHQGSKIEKIDDQDTTDFQKCIATLAKWEEQFNREHHTNHQPMPIIAIGGLSGRFDQSMHSIHVLYQALEQQRSIYLVADESAVFLLDRGNHRIYVDPTLEGPTCGLLPIGHNKIHVSTSGLRWNLVNAETSFGRLLSTSNALDDTIININTSDPIIWTVELR
ncbi:thiamine pyrophosphokinase [Syncephalis plumigaleata]|nr:thiamine pyrophosphokinase [Syncephalis plumigaleata]